MKRVVWMVGAGASAIKGSWYDDTKIDAVMMQQQKVKFMICVCFVGGQ